MIKNIKRGATGTAWALAVLVGATSCASNEPPPTSTASASPVAQPAMRSASRDEARPQARPESRIARAFTGAEAPAAAQAPAAEAAPETARGARAPATAGARADRRGRFKVVRLPAKNLRNIKMRDSGFLEEVVSDMSSTVNPRFPVDVPVSFVELGEANAFYSPQTRSISIGYELLDQMILLFSKNADRSDPTVAAKVAQQVVDTLSFVFYHEAAHAIIDLDDLPITGREEDDADQLATVMIVASARAKTAATLKNNGMTHRAQGGSAAINGALFFLLSSGDASSDVSQLPFWDEHSLSPQRFYNILIWVYGSDPDKYAYLVDQKVIPRERAAKARAEFTRMVRSWLRILEDAHAA